MKSKFFAIYSGLGMGLLLGIIMGLSVSPTVKIVMGGLATFLGGFLAYDKSIFVKQNSVVSAEPQGTSETLKEIKNSGVSDSSEKDFAAIDSGCHEANETPKAIGVAGISATSKSAEISLPNVVLQDLRVGTFAFAVVIGIFLGMIVRTNELFAPTISERISQWTKAGYTKEYAKKLVLLQKFGIDPNSNEMQPLGDIQKSASTSLFSTYNVQNLDEKFDPDKWNNSIEIALSGIWELKIYELSHLAELITKNISKNQCFSFFRKLQVIFYKIRTSKSKTNSKTNYKAITDDTGSWEGNELMAIATILNTLSPNAKLKITRSMRNLFKMLEEKNEN